MTGLILTSNILKAFNISQLCWLQGIDETQTPWNVVKGTSFAFEGRTLGNGRQLLPEYPRLARWALVLSFLTRSSPAPKTERNFTKMGPQMPDESRLNSQRPGLRPVALLLENETRMRFRPNSNHEQFYLHTMWICFCRSCWFFFLSNVESSLLRNFYSSLRLSVKDETSRAGPTLPSPSEGCSG